MRMMRPGEKYPDPNWNEVGPELLGVLKELMREQQPLRGGTIGERHPLQTAREKAAATIAKAEGRT